MMTKARGSAWTYTAGFVFSVLLTLIAYLLVTKHYLSGWGLTAGILGLAVVQLMVQLVAFLHLGRESRPRWNLLAFLFMTMVVLIVVLGSLWIMHHLNYNMTPQDTNSFLIKDEGYTK